MACARGGMIAVALCVLPLLATAMAGQPSPDPDATAWLELGKAELARAQAGDGERYAVAERALDRAQALQPDAAPTLHALASLYMRTGRPELAATVLLRGIRVHPDAAELHSRLGYVYRYAGLLDDSIAQYRIAQHLDDTSGNVASAEAQIVKAFIYQGEYEQALGAHDHAVALLAELDRQPDEKLLFYQGVAHLYAGQREQALHSFDAALAVRPATLWSRFAQAYRHALLGEKEQLLELADVLRHDNVSDGERRYRLVHFYALADAAPRALEQLEAAFRAGFFSEPYIRSDPFLAGLRSTPGFERTLSRIRQRHLAFVRDYGPATGTTNEVTR